MYLCGYVVDWIEEDEQVWTIMALAEPEYSPGSPGTPGTPSTGTPGSPGYFPGTPGSPPTPAGVGFVKSNTLFAVPGRVLKKKGFWSGAFFYVFPVRLTSDYVAFEARDVIVVMPVPPAVRAEEYSPDTYQGHPAIKAPGLPYHLRDLDGRVLLVCDDHYQLGEPFAPVPPLLSLRFNPGGTAKVYRALVEADPSSGYFVAGPDAERVRWWAASHEKTDDATDYIMGRRTPFFIGIDRETLIQEQRDRRAISILEQAVELDSLWSVSYALLVNCYRALALNEQALNMVSAAFRRAELDSIWLARFESARKGKITWPSDPFKARARRIDQGPQRRRKWRVGGQLTIGSRYSDDSPELVGTDGIIYAPGLCAMICLSNDLAFETLWAPWQVRLGFVQSEFPRISGFWPDHWHADRFALSLKYQTPVRVQFWSRGTRVHIGAGVARWHESFVVDYFSDGKPLDADVVGWAFDVSMGLSPRRSFSQPGWHSWSWEIGYRFGKTEEFETLIGGQEAEVISDVNGKRMSLDPQGLRVSLRYHW
jgi:hypothetical protein